MRVLFRSRFRDHNFVQFFRREVLRAIAVKSTGVSTVTPELIFRAARKGFRVVGLEAEYHRRAAGRSTISAKKVFFAACQTLWLRWLLWTG